MKTSVALCTYNGEKFIRQQIDSILDQTKKVDEIVVCDDGSTDSTVSILDSYQEKHP
ncbi:glycosyltransferase, partial [Kaistella sp.]